MNYGNIQDHAHPALTTVSTFQYPSKISPAVPQHLPEGRRRAGLIALRESLDAATVTKADFAKAHQETRPSVSAEVEREYEDLVRTLKQERPQGQGFGFVPVRQLNDQRKVTKVQITYHIGKHDGGWAYRLEDVWSEPYGSHDAALLAAKEAALRQEARGKGAEILYQDADGSWHQEYVSPTDRPATSVVDS